MTGGRLANAIRNVVAAATGGKPPRARRDWLAEYRQARARDRAASSAEFLGDAPAGWGPVDLAGPLAAFRNAGGSGRNSFDGLPRGAG